MALATSLDFTKLIVIWKVGNTKIRKSFTSKSRKVYAVFEETKLN